MLTDKGMELRQMLDDARNQAESLVTQGLSPEQIEVFRTCLRQVMTNLGSDQKPPKL